MKYAIATLSFLASLVFAANPVGAESEPAPADAQSANSTPNQEGVAEADARAFVGAELFTTYRLDLAEDADFNAFELDRAELHAGFDERGLGGFITNLEVIRSASPESLIGIDNNSLVARLKQAFLYLDPKLGPGKVDVRLGLIDDMWIATLEGGYDIRATRPLISERALLFDTSDLGLTLGYELWDGMVSLHWQLTNGEGRNQTEQNTGKNSTVVASFRLADVALLGDEATLGVHGIYRDGSLGVAVARNHRYGAGLTFAHPRLGAGAEFVLAEGTAGRPDADGQVLGVWANARILPRYLGAFAAFDQHEQDVDIDDTTISIISGGLFIDLIEWEERLMLGAAADASRDPIKRLRVYLAYQRWSFNENAGAVGGSPETSNLNRIMLTAEGRGLLSTFFDH